MVEVHVDFKVKIEGKTGDARAIKGVLGISQTNPSSTCTGPARYSRANQYYSSSPAGTDLLTELKRCIKLHLAIVSNKKSGDHLNDALWQNILNALGSHHMHIIWAHKYWPLVMDVARRNKLPTILSLIRCCQIMGQSEQDELSAAQIFYPCMQFADVFFLKVTFGLSDEHR
ncbi:unnamed protein product [Fraxinus pennsylvanica]|uniref:tyrosine--tRNA ligase n=1 Tax=Fraxinus pennsylvanica TaxID=56036 RepID=A0AAD2E5P4_9LAMI|nr:unnamed protein product [Fraxinus pennsylvanica]